MILDRLANLTSQYESHSKAMAFIQYAITRAVARDQAVDPLELFQARYPHSKHLSAIQKAAVPGGTTDNWGAPLVPLPGYASEFLALVRPASVLGRMQGFRRVPFLVKFTKQTSGATAGWVGEYKPIPVGKLDMNTETFEHSKIGGIIVISKELARSSDPAAEALIQRDIVASVAKFTDEQFLDPSVAGSNANPASITHGAVEVQSSGSDAQAISSDLRALVAALAAAGSELQAPYFIMKPATALHLAALPGESFPGVKITGGDIWGIPVLVSSNASDRITLVDAAELMLADGDVQLDAAEEAALQMDDAPTDGAAQMVSLFQTNSIAFRAIRTIRWRMRNPGAVAYISGVTY